MPGLEIRIRTTTADRAYDLEFFFKRFLGIVLMEDEQLLECKAREWLPGTEDDEDREDQAR